MLAVHVDIVFNNSMDNLAELERLAQLFDESRIDPVLVSILGDTDDVQNRILSRLEGMRGKRVSTDLVMAELEPLDERLVREGWYEGKLTVSGKARPFHPSAYKRDGNTPALGDELGEFVLLRDEEFVCLGFDLTIDDEGNYDKGPVGLLIVPAEAYQGNFDIDYSSALMLFDEDKEEWAARFEEPSSEMIALDLKRGPAKLHRVVDEAVHASASDRARSDFLRRLRVDGVCPDLGDNYPLQENLGKFVYETLKFDSQVPYEITVTGQIGVVEQSGITMRELTDDSGKPTSLTVKGYVEDILMEESGGDGMITPLLIVVMPSARGEFGWNCILIPAENISSPIRNTRPRRSLLGSATLRLFDTVGGVMKFLEEKSSKHPQEQASELTDNDTEGDGEGDASVDALEGIKIDDWNDDIAYNATKQRFEISLKEDIEKVTQAFSLFLEELPGSDKNPINEDDLAQVLIRLRNEILPGIRLQAGDKMLISGPIRIIDNGTSDGVGMSAVVGTFKKLNIMIDSRSVEGVVDYNLMIELSDCIFEGESGLGEKRTSEVYIPLRGGEQEIVNFAKIEPELT